MSNTQFSPTEVMASLRKTRRRPEIPALLETLRFDKICEVGVFKGGNLKDLLTVKCASQVYAVDIWRDDGVPSRCGETIDQQKLDAMHDEVVRWSVADPRLKIIRKLSHEAVTMFADGYFDYVYIDSDHSYPAIRQDIALWSPKVRSGGIFAGHDYSVNTMKCGTPFGVIQAVNEYVAANNLKDWFHTTDRRFSSWFIVKP